VTSTFDRLTSKVCPLPAESEMLIYDCSFGILVQLFDAQSQYDDLVNLNCDL